MIRKKVLFYKNYIESFYPKFKYNFISEIEDIIHSLTNLVSSLDTQNSNDLFDIKLDIIINKLVVDK